ncbi:HTH_48 domain-containing protein, partial [Nephila pilipes]
NTSAQIKDELDAVYGNSVPSIMNVKFWATEFKRGRTSFGDDEYLGRPKTTTIDYKIDKVHRMELENRRIEVREMSMLE